MELCRARAADPRLPAAEWQNRVYIVGISDRMYNDQQWIGEVQSAVDKVIAVDTANLAPNRPSSASA